MKKIIQDVKDGKTTLKEALPAVLCGNKKLAARVEKGLRTVQARMRRVGAHIPFPID